MPDRSDILALMDKHEPAPPPLRRCGLTPDQVRVLTGRRPRRRFRLCQPVRARVVRIAALLRAGLPFNASRIRQEFGVSRETFRRDIAFLRRRLDWRIEFDAHRNVYRLVSEPGTAPATLESMTAVRRK